MPYVLMLQTDADDQELTEAILEEMNWSVPVNFLANIDDLDNYTELHDLPAVILFSDNTRGMAVKPVRSLKSNSRYAHIPVIVLGEKSIASYIQECYKAGANTFITKPSSLDLTRKKIEGFFRYWFEIAEV